jgi:hypothetical protein
MADQQGKVDIALADYADTHAIYDLFKNMVEETLIARPDDVLSFFAEHLRMKKGNAHFQPII